MQVKIKQLMESEGLSTSRFAQLLAIQPSGVSHIVSGRNKPSFELLQRILRRFPHINPDWLLLDSEQVYRSEPGVQTSRLIAKSSEESPTTPILDLFVEENQEKLPSQPLASVVTTVVNEVKSQDDSAPAAPTAPTAPVAPVVPVTSRRRANIERVVIFYDDGTFTSYDTKS